MKLKLIHSCMVLGVLALLFCYSAFLTQPQFNEDNTITNTDAKILQQELGLSPPDPPQEVAPPVASSHLQQSIPMELEPSLSQPEGKRRGEQKRDLSLPSSPQAPPSTKEPTVAPPSSPAVRGFPPTRDFYDPGFTYPNFPVCPNEGEGIRLLILIMSAPAHFSAREAIRLTWAHYGQRSDVSIAFLIGRTSNETVVEGMDIEKHLYDDLIIANFADSYDNLTLKTMGMLEWIETNCNQSQFVLKTDDDMFINVPNILNFIGRIEVDDAKEAKIYGRLAKKWKPVRNKKSKYYISFQQYKKTVYPDFTTGPAYLFATRLASRLLNRGLDNTYLKLEDVYTTGIVAQDLSIKRINVGDFANKKVNFHKTGFCALSRLMSMHMVAFHEQFELWKKLLDGRTKCKIVYQTKSDKKLIPKKSPFAPDTSTVTLRTLPAS